MLFISENALITTSLIISGISADLPFSIRLFIAPCLPVLTVK